MTKTANKPKFEVERGGVNTMGVYDADGSKLVFNAQRVGPVNYFRLSEAQYGSEGLGFAEPTFGELSPLVHAASGTKDTKEAKQVISTLRGYWMTGKTMALTGKEGIFADDDPDLELIKDPQKYEVALKNRLGRRQENDVRYSDDGLVRFAPHGFQLEAQRALDFSRNSGLIALVGNGQRADMLAKASEHYTERYTLKPWLGTKFSKTESAELRVPNVSVGGFVGSLLVVGVHPGGDWCSFGVRKSAEGTRAEKKQ